ncbi:MAG: sulfotransferase family protein [Dermatophilaceae bacterium]
MTTSAAQPALDLQPDSADEPETAATPTGGRPIFIVGCQRSGTTMLRLMLDSHPRISCGPETRFLEGFEPIFADDWKRLSQYGFSEDEWVRRIREFFEGVQTDYARSRGKQRWADKTPRYAMNLPLVLRIFPDAQIVHVIRDPRDVAVSHRKRFGYWSCLKSTVKWPRYVGAARGAARELPADSYREVRYEHLVADPAATLHDLLDWVGEPWDPAVLEFDKGGHDVPARYHAQLAARQASAGTDGAVYASRVGSYRRELDPLVRVMVWANSRRLRRDLGY